MSEPAMNQTREARNVFLILTIQEGNAKVRTNPWWPMFVWVKSWARAQRSSSCFIHVSGASRLLSDLVRFNVASRHSVTQPLFPQCLQLKVSEFQWCRSFWLSEGSGPELEHDRFSQKASSDSAAIGNRLPFGRKHRKLVVICNLVTLHTVLIFSYSKTLWKDLKCAGRCAQVL